MSGIRLTASVDVENTTARLAVIAGAPGLGPMSVRGEIVVFKEGFRSRQYCIRECAEVCALQADAK